MEDEIKFIKEVNMETRSAKTSDHQVLTHDSRPAITNNTNVKKPLHVHFSEDEPVIIDIETPAQKRQTVEDKIKIMKEVNKETRSAKTSEHQVSTHDTRPAITNNTNDKKPLHVHFPEDEYIIIDIEIPAQERETVEDEIKIIKEVNMRTRSAKTPGPAITNNTNENAPLDVYYSEDEPVIIDIETPAQERKTLEDEIKIVKEVCQPKKHRRPLH